MPNLRALRRELGEGKVKLDLADRVLHRYDAIAQGAVPLAVVYPETTDEVARVVRFAREEGLPLFPRGGASGLSGGAVPTAEGIVLATNRMTRLAIDPVRRLARAQVGVVTAWISERARPHGLYYPPDPASYRMSTIGGNLAENAGGPQCFKKGVTGDYVVAATVVDASGEVHRVGGREAGDVLGLFIGSEGTLVVFTEAELRLEPLPRHTRTLAAFFETVEAAAAAAFEAIRRGAMPAKLEFMDRGCIRAVEAAFGYGLDTDAGAMLLVDTDGDDLDVVLAELAEVEDAFLAHGGRVRRAEDGAEADRLWQARRAVSPALGRIRPFKLNEDIAVPRSKLVEVVHRIQALGEDWGFPLVQFGHIGDGNLHPNILYGPGDDQKRVHALAHEIARVAIQAGGVITGEHGVGLLKRDFLKEAVDGATLEAYRAVKRAFDLEGLLNPGKLLP